MEQDDQEKALADLKARARGRNIAYLGEPPITSRDLDRLEDFF
jgi:hypothetical protein